MQIFMALWPVFALLIVGVGLRRSDFLGDKFWPAIERFVYFVCFPALLITRLSVADFTGSIAIDFVFAVFALLTIATFSAFMLQRLIGFKPAAFTSVFQGGLRFNTYIALGAAATLLPDKGVIYAAVIASVMIPILNLLCVLVFALYQENKPSPRRVVLNIIQNPLIIGCLVGLSLSLAGIQLPWMIDSVLKPLADIALPLGLLAVGAALNLKALRSASRELAVAVGFRLIFMPMIALFVAYFLQMGQDAFVIFLVFAAVPTASASYILARQLGGDAVLMSGILSAQTLVSMLSLPLVLTLFPQIYAQILIL